MPYQVFEKTDDKIHVTVFHRRRGRTIKTKTITLPGVSDVNGIMDHIRKALTGEAKTTRKSSGGDH